MQATLVSVAASPITLLVISIADFSKHATPELLRAMRDEVCVCASVCVCVCVWVGAHTRLLPAPRKVLLRCVTEKPFGGHTVALFGLLEGLVGTLEASSGIPGVLS